VAWTNGNARPGRDATQDGHAPVAVGSPVYVAATALPIVQEARLEAPPLIDIALAATPPPPATRRIAAITASPTRSQAGGPVGAPGVVAAPSRESVIDDGRGEASAAPVAWVPSTPQPVPDRWQPLRSALAQCGTANGLIARAMCEQEARLTHCEGYWGLVAVCPTTRSEYGQ
jgi:hypothetical protein